MMDAEPGAEVYAVATTREQAMSVYKPAFDNFRKWARRSPGVRRSFKIHEGKNLEQITMDSAVFKPLPANAESLDGLNPHAILFDELHAQKSPDVWEVMESALGRASSRCYPRSRRPASSSMACACRSGRTSSRC